DEIKDEYADYLIDYLTESFTPNLKQRIVKRVAQSPVDLERRITSAVHGTHQHGAFLRYQTAGMPPSRRWGSTGPRCPTSISAARGAIRAQASAWGRAGTPRRSSVPIYSSTSRRRPGPALADRCRRRCLASEQRDRRTTGSCSWR